MKFKTQPPLNIKMKKYLKYVVILIVGALLGILANRNREYLINAQFIRNHWHGRKAIENKDTLLNSPKIMVCLAFGQSNAGNYGLGSYECKNKNKIFNFYKGKIYQAKEPLLGPDGAGTSVWTRLADMVIDSGLYTKVLIVPCAIGGTSSQCWVDGDCRKTLDETLKYLQEQKIPLTHIFWDQGETDNVDKVTKEQYKKNLKAIIKVIRDKQFTAPFFASVTSYFPYDNTNPLGIDSDITGAQTEVIDEMDDVKYGPNTDSINLAYYRHEAVHFTEKGLDKLALEWYKKIKENK